MAACPSCGRRVAAERPRCLYCGALLPAGAGGEPVGGRAAPPAGPVEPPGPASVLLVLDYASAEPDLVARALGLPGYEAAQRVRRGGYQLHRVAAPAAARAETERLAGIGLVVIEVPDAEARAAGSPLVALGGRRLEGGLELRTPEGPLRLVADDLLIVVRGPIAREYQAELAPRKVRTATLDPGYRIHLHRRSEVRPVELDPGSFSFDAGAPPVSSLLELADWVAALAEGVPVDDAFRQLAPVLAPAAPDAGALAGVGGVFTEAVAARADAQRAVPLDNLAQFRFYSGWRGAVERRGRTEGG